MRARYITAGEGGVDPTDRGLAYGDGLFETMSLRAGRVERLSLHLDRLREGCARLELPMPAETELERRIGEAAAAIERGTLKLILTRGAGPRGYAPPAAPVPTVILLPEARFPAPVSGITVTVLSTRLGENEKLAGIKHLNRLEQVLGRLELVRVGADEGLMLSTSGAVIGGTSRNLFAVYGDRVRTPAVDRAGIAGVMRRAVLEQCAALGIDAAAAKLVPADLERADALFMTNALVGIQPVTRLDRKTFASPAMAQRLSAALGIGEQGGA
ncbi:MAG TPA: aminodeoxychorismate lyase [Gammaproteobacteria bacterium]|nr:aminodeoxychorismate lyase [Gammaproteobacteria bacterium]